MIQYLFYGNTDKYEYGRLAVQKQLCFQETVEGWQQTVNEYIGHYRAYFIGKDFSELLIVGFKMDPTNNAPIEILMNEYAKNPLRTRIVINAAAKPTQGPNKIQKVAMPDPIWQQLQPNLFTNNPAEEVLG